MKQPENEKVTWPQQRVVVSDWRGEWGMSEMGFGKETEGSVLVVIGVVVDTKNMSIWPGLTISD